MTLSAPVPALAPHALLVFLVQAGVLLTLALVLGRLGTRLGLPPVVGELCAGVLMGPSLLDHVAPVLANRLFPADPGQFHLLDVVAQVGVLLLVGMTGIELDPRMFRHRRRAVLSIGLAGLLLPLAFGVAVGLLLPGALVPHGISRTTLSLFMGVALCVSALPVIAKTLADMRLLHRDVGQLTLAVGTFDDVVGWLLLSVVSAMAVGRASVAGVGEAVGRTVLVVFLAATVGRVVVRHALDRSGRLDDPGPSIATATAVVLLSAAATQALGMEAVFGALLGGALVGTCGSAVLGQLAPLRRVVLAVFAPLFFATAGLRIDLTSLRDPIVLVTAAAVILAAVLGKFLGAFLGALSLRMSRWEALALGAGMNARGVIEVVIATAGLRLGVLNTATYTVVILVAVVTSLMAPPVLGLAMRRVEQTTEEQLRKQSYAAFSCGGEPAPHEDVRPVGTHPAPTAPPVPSPGRTL